MLFKFEGQGTALLPEAVAATGARDRVGLGRFPAALIELKVKTARRNTIRNRFMGTLLCLNEG